MSLRCGMGEGGSNHVWHQSGLAELLFSCEEFTLFISAFEVQLTVGGCVSCSLIMSWGQLCLMYTSETHLHELNGYQAMNSRAARVGLVHTPSLCTMNHKRFICVFVIMITKLSRNCFSFLQLPWPVCAGCLIHISMYLQSLACLHLVLQWHRMLSLCAI